MLSEFLVRRFLKNEKTQAERDKYGYLSGIIGIGVNIVLFGVKLATGLMINSIAFIGDALNNLTDAASSLVTIVGFKLAGKPADAEHPFGHGRIEYIAGLIVSFLIILVGYELLKSSFGRILNPVAVTFSWPAFAIVCAAVITKSWLFVFNRYLSRTIDSKALLATAYDSLSDTVATGCIGVSLVASVFMTFPLDGYVGVIVAFVILYSGISLTKETISPLLGEVPEQELIRKISHKIQSYQGVIGIHDLIVHSYGPGRYMASIHVELPANQGIIEMHEYVDMIERRVSNELGILLTVHMDPLNPDCQENNKMRTELTEILMCFPEVLSYHDLRIVGMGERENLVFDIVLKTGTPTEHEKQLRLAINQKIQERYPHYYCVITFDHNDMLQDLEARKQP